MKLLKRGEADAVPYQSNVPPIADISILSVQGSYRRIWHNACFLFMLSGEIQVEVDGHASYLNGHAIMLVEADTPYTVTGHGSNLVMVIRMDYDFYAQGKAQRGLGILVCNSAEDDERDYSMLRQMLSHIALNYFETSRNKKLRQLELCYALLYYLNTTHYVSGSLELMGGLNYEKRGRQIVSYIESNYMHELQLETLTELTDLTRSHLSRLFKKMTGTNFKDYLQEVRLRHAVEEMRRTDHTITAIAFNNGFPNANALNTAIRRKYGVVSTEFRDTLSKEIPAEAELEPYQVVEYDEVRTNLQILAGSDSPNAFGIYRYPDQIEYHIEDVTKFEPIRPIWKAMINAGKIRVLANAGFETQLALAQREIGFHFARLESVLTDESIPQMADGKYNFSNFDRAITLLQSYKLVPVLDLSLKGDYLLLSESQIVHRGGRPKKQSDHRDFVNKVSALLRHCINTFGANEVEQWGVEIGALHDEMLTLLERPRDYVGRFKAVYRMIKEWLPNMLVGGPDHNIAIENEFLENVLIQLQKEGIMFDFLSLCAIPHTLTDLEDNSVRFVVSPNPNYIRDSVTVIRDFMTEHLSTPIPIWITTFGPEVRTRNHVSDSCYQATFIAKNTLDLIGLVDVIGYWQLSDIDTEYIDTSRILFGGTGILSKDGLKKPGFTTLKRLSSINTNLIEKSGNLLMTTNGINTYNIVLYNYAHFTNEYCLSGGDGVTYDNAYTVFGDAATRDISVNLNGLQAGRYKVITTTLNRESGSLFDEWLRYGIIDELQPHDIRYLHDIVHPHRSVRYQDCENGSMKLTLQMLPHEIKFLILIREL